jgi:hypothetical protein
MIVDGHLRFTEMRKGFHSLAAQVQTTLRRTHIAARCTSFGDIVVTLTMAQLSMLLESIDWRATAWAARPEVVA